jgi:hypothetical protein
MRLGLAAEHDDNPDVAGQTRDFLQKRLMLEKNRAPFMSSN